MVTPPLGILDLLGLRGFDRSLPSKLIRHRDARYDVNDLLRRGWLEAYQSYQAKPVFRGLTSIVSFIGVGTTQARLFGVFRVNGGAPPQETELPPGCPYLEWKDNPHFYLLERDPQFSDLDHRIIVEWGAVRAWHQRLSNKAVVQLLPSGQSLPPFTDYLEFTLTYAELRHLYEHQELNREWRSRLSAVAGVYLILATTTGAQYVGSASGEAGIWGRWSAYARDGHGGNTQLRDLLARDHAFPEAFTYSVLQILPRTLARPDVLMWELAYKRKLGSRATGLNIN